MKRHSSTVSWPPSLPSCWQNCFSFQAYFIQIHIHGSIFLENSCTLYILFNCYLTVTFISVKRWVFLVCLFNRYIVFHCTITSFGAHWYSTVASKSVITNNVIQKCFVHVTPHICEDSFLKFLEAELSSLSPKGFKLFHSYQATYKYLFPYTLAKIFKKPHTHTKTKPIY